MRIRLFILISFFSFSLAHAQQTKFFRTYSMGLFDVGESVITLSDTSYVVAGTSNNTGMNGTDMLLYKTNSMGDVTWWKNYGGVGIQSAKSAVITADSSGFMLAGYKNNFDSTGYDIWVVKTNLLGDTVWTNSYGGANWEIAHSINKLSDSTYLIAGETFSFGSGLRDFYAIHIDTNGDTLWTRTYGGPQNEVANYVLVDRYDHILLVGSTESFGVGNSDAYLVYLDMNGDTIWTRTIGTVDDDYGYSADMFLDTADAMGFVIGYTSYYAPDLDQNSYMLRIDSLGNSMALFPEHEVSADMLDRIKVRSTHPGKAYFTAGLKYAFDEISIIYTQTTMYGLSIQAQATYGSGGNEGTLPNDIYRTLDGGYIITGYSENWGPGPTSCFLLKTDSTLAAPNTPQIGIENLTETSLSIFPNPVEGNYFYINSSLAIEGIKIYNLTGQLIRTYNTGNSAKSITLEKPVVPSGIYVVEIQTTNGVVCKKIIF